MYICRQRKRKRERDGENNRSAQTDSAEYIIRSCTFETICTNCVCGRPLCVCDWYAFNTATSLFHPVALLTIPLAFIRGPISCIESPQERDRQDSSFHRCLRDTVIDVDVDRRPLIVRNTGGTAALTESIVPTKMSESTRTACTTRNKQRRLLERRRDGIGIMMD